MTMSVIFCFSYDLLEWDFIAYKINIVSVRKHIVDMNVVNEVTCTCQSVITRGHMIFSLSGRSPGRAIVLTPTWVLASVAGKALSGDLSCLCDRSCYDTRSSTE